MTTTTTTTDYERAVAVIRANEWKQEGIVTNDLTQEEVIFDNALVYVSQTLQTALDDHELACECSCCVFIRAAVDKYNGTQAKPGEYNE